MELNHSIKKSQLNIKKDDLSEVIKKTFLAENEILSNNDNIDSSLSGTTCVSVIYTPERLIVANIGDSRAILGKQLANGNWTYENLSRDHKPTLPDEEKRILDAGGIIRPMMFTDENGEKTYDGPLRVYMSSKPIPGLAMTRSFGDYYASLAGTISEPEISVHSFTDEDKFMVLASDGLFEFIDSQEVVDIAKKYYLEDDIVSGCETLYSISVNRWLKNEEDTVDDITIILVFFE